MYVRGIRTLFRFRGQVVSEITMSGHLVQVNLRRDGRWCRPYINKQINRILLQSPRRSPSPPGSRPEGRQMQRCENRTPH